MTVHFATGQRILNPSLQASTGVHIVGGKIQAPLVDMNAQGVPSPCLARMVWRVITGRSATARSRCSTALSPRWPWRAPRRMGRDPRFEVTTRGNEGDARTNGLEFNQRNPILADFWLRRANTELILWMLIDTHDFRAAVQVCDLAAVMKDGEVVEHGPIGQVFDAPEHPYTKALLASVPGRACATI